MFRNVWVRCVVIAAIISLPLLGSFLFSAPSASAAAFTCTNLLQNSDMEGGAGWIFGRTPAQGGYSTTQYVSPIRSARLGITGPGNVKSFSSVRQLVNAPAGPMLQLRLQVLPLSQPYDGQDIQEILIMDTTGNTTLRTLWSATVATGVWQPLNFDISEFAGQSFMLYINVYNDGYGGRTAMYVDDVYLELCSSATATVTPTSGFVTATPTTGFVTATPTAGFVTATPTSGFITATPTPVVVTNTPTNTPTPNYVTATPTFVVVTNTPTQGPGFVTATPTLIVVTNTPTPIPPGPYPTPTYTPVPPGPGGPCIEVLLNTSFETQQGWSFGKTKLKPGYVYDKPYTGYRSVVMGTAGRPNSNSYSSTRQRVNLPRGPYTTAYLEFWHYTMSDLEPDDYQELIILDARGKTERILWRVNRDDRQWMLEHFDMNRFLGQSIYVYFNVRNHGHGGSASMYVDDVSLQLCSGVGAVTTTQPGNQQPAQTLTLTPVTTPAFVLGTTAPSDSATDDLTAPEFATAIPVDATDPAAPGADQATPPSSSATEAADVAAPGAGQVTSTPTPTIEILATPTPLGGDKVVSEESARSFWSILLRTLMFLAIVIGILILMFLAWRVIMGRRKQKETP